MPAVLKERVTQPITKTGGVSKQALIDGARPHMGQARAPEVAGRLPKKVREGLSLLITRKKEGTMPFTMGFIEAPSDKPDVHLGPTNINIDNDDGSVGPTITLAMSNVGSKSPDSKNDGTEGD